MTRDEATELVEKLLDADQACFERGYRRSYMLDRAQIKEQVINALTTKTVLEKPAVVKGSDLKVGDMIEVWWHPNRDIITKLEPYKGPLAQMFPNGAQLAEFFSLRVGMTVDNSDYYFVHERKM